MEIAQPVENKKTIPEISYETTVLFEFLKDFQPEQFASYDELSKLIGRNVRVYRSHLASAIRKCLNEKSIVIKTVRNEGIKRLSDEDAVAVQHDLRQHFRRMARKSNRELATVDYGKLARSSQIAHNLLATYNGTVVYFSTEHNIKRIESKVEEAQKRLPIGKTLEIFK